MSSNIEIKNKTLGNISDGREHSMSSPSSPQSRFLSSSSNPELTRLSRSKTMNYQPGSGPIRPVTPTSPYQQKSRSPTQVGRNMSPTKYPPGRSHGSIDNSDCPTPSNIQTSRTLSNLQRSKTSRLGPGPGVYSKNMWDEDEYVDTGGQSIPRTPTGGPAARRINQQKKMQTVKLPKNPFIDEETTDDYADMTGHMNDSTGMDELRSAHNKSMKIRSNTVTSSDDVATLFADGDLSRSRNFSMSSSRTSSQSSRLKRSDTSPAFQREESLKEKFSGIQRNGSMRSIQPPIEEAEGSTQFRSSPSLPKTNSTSGNGEFQVRRTMSGNSFGNTMKSQISVHSPAHSGVSAETSNTFLPSASGPSSPAVVYKSSDKNTLDPQVAIVVEETGPTSPMYAPFAKGSNDKIQNGSTLHDSRELKFEPATSNSRWKTILPIILIAILIIGLVAGIAVLVSIVVNQNGEIDDLKNEIAELQNKPIMTNRPATTVMPEKYTTNTLNAESFTTIKSQPKATTSTGSAQTRSTSSLQSTSTGSTQDDSNAALQTTATITTKFAETTSARTSAGSRLHTSQVTRQTTASTSIDTASLETTKLSNPSMFTTLAANLTATIKEGSAVNATSS